MIIGDPNVIKEAKAAPAGNRSVYINWDAISDLPDQFEVVVTEVKFDPRNLATDFSDVGNGTWMPQPHLMYEIAEACGIAGGDVSATEPIIEEIDINPMLCKPLEAPPVYRRMTVGKQVRKFSTRMQEDGTFARSSVCTSAYNVWERCCELWSKEEMYTDGYKKAGKYPNKYDTPQKRKAHFDGEMKFAHAKAETKAHLKTIRELAGLVTGYKAGDLVSGKLIFAKVRKSREILKAESAARLSALSREIEAPKEITATLFGPSDPEENIEHDDFQNVTETEEPPVFAEPVEEKPSKRDELMAVLNHYTNEGLIVPESQESVSNVLSWLKRDANAEESQDRWGKCIDILRFIESKIPEEGRLTHNL
jgi:hypothetical protein